MFPAVTKLTRVAVGRLAYCPRCKRHQIIINTVLSPYVEAFCDCVSGPIDEQAQLFQPTPAESSNESQPQQ